VLDGATQVKTTCDDDVLISFLVKAVEAFGTLGNVAPFPVAESEELPKKFWAVTLAVTDEAYARENGDARRTEAGMVHAVVDWTVELFSPSQFDVSVDHELSACWIWIT